MTGMHTAKRIAAGEIDAEVAARAMRRIKDCLMRHPAESASRAAADELSALGQDLGI
ncbi:hypothetical protein IU433_17935 [Nocardia puris]|uniref:hypothetical protein n=1 Tax=Nocardia puris TaxID=208602 RepID=UPI001893BC31|nr:hypothetical protein [Nocardia puris]MBF6212325.1 hypothetical protein [Nocardia puris]MBF6366572.1 hypothetical protein [Nocardia puris]MBF6460914.1 hypothetical protein [Nocardia puris]